MADRTTTFHAVRLIQDQCKGCVNCIKHCPTEAIRVRGGKAEILELRCIDCGECIRVCPNHAKTAVTDSMEMLKDFRVRIALPAPALYGQFEEKITPQDVLDGLIDIGFDDVFEVALAADLITVQVRRELEKSGGVRPLISSSCPAVVRLIQVRFPNLIENIVPVVAPVRLAALIARKEAARRFKVAEDEVGLFFLSPCPAKAAAIREPVGFHGRATDGVIPVSEVFGLLGKSIRRNRRSNRPRVRPRASPLGIGWARAGGENQAVALGRQISVDGVHNVIKVFEDMERGKLSNVDYVEALACVGGCVGGVLAVENPFIARRRIRMLAEPSPGEKRRKRQSPESMVDSLDDSLFRHEEPIQPRPAMALSDDMEEAIQRMERMEAILETLPGLDCGSCGAPTCQAMAEDIVRGLGVETDCVFVLRERLHELAQELGELSSKLPPAMKRSESHDQDELDRMLGWRGRTPRK